MHRWLPLVAIVFTIGCQSAPYQAATLPRNLVATVPVSANRLDLTALERTHDATDTLHPGDVVEVTLETGLEEQREPWTVRVAEDGTANIPLVGSTRLVGYRTDRAGGIVRQASVERGIYRNPNVTVRLVERRTNRVLVLGAVSSPGQIELPSAQSDLLTALTTAGGLKPTAETEVSIRVPGQGDEKRIDLRRPENYTADQVALPDGAVVQVKDRPPRTVFVMGLVNLPNRFEIPPDEPLRVLDAVALAGGRKMEIADKIHIVRQVPGTGQPALIEVSFKAAQQNTRDNLLLADGDVVSVEETPTTFTLSLLQSFIRFGFSSTLP